MKKFAAKGLDLLDAGDANNATALIYAADAGHTAVLDVLLTAGADAAVVDEAEAHGLRGGGAQRPRRRRRAAARRAPSAAAVR